MQRNWDDANLLYVTNRADWHDWLKAHYKTEREAWLVYYRKRSGMPRITYNDAVEEALSFGWIDSIVRNVDQDRFAQRFSVRNPGSPYSQANKERLRALIAQGRVVEEVLATLPPLDEEPFEIPPDIREAIQANPEAWQHFLGFSQAYIRIRIAFIEGARKRPEEFQKRLRHFIRMSAQNKQFGFGGIEKYY